LSSNATITSWKSKNNGVFSFLDRGSGYGLVAALVPEDYVHEVEEQRLFQELVNDLAFAMYRIALEEQHRQAEAALAASEARYRDLVENLEDLVFATDLEGRITYLSPAAKNYGFTLDEVSGRCFTDFIHPEDLPGLLQCFQRTLAGAKEPYTFRGIGKEGQLFYVRSTSRRRMENGRVAGINGLLIDVTQIHRVQQALQLSAERWQATFDAISDVVCIMTSDHRFVEVNEAGCRALGLPREAIVGHHYVDLSIAHANPLACCLGPEVASTVPNHARHQAGDQVYEAVTWPLYATSGERQGYVLVIKDISAEVAISNQKAKLEEQLRLSQRLEAIGRLAGGVAHDFNNILSVILSYVGFAIAELPDGDPIREDLQEVRAASQRAATLTKQLLAFSRKQVLAPEIINLNDVVTNVGAMIRRLLGENIHIAIDLDPGLGFVSADPSQLEQVIVNLCVNARDAMDHRGTLTLTTANEDNPHVKDALPPGAYVTLSIRDTGCGMDDVEQEHIFEPFFTTKAKGKGTGLGLAMVYGIVTQSSGHIRVVSSLGQGADFRIYLPRVQEPPAFQRQKTAPRLLSGRERILIVEDEEGVRKVAERLLSGAGYRCLSAPDGHQALAHFTRHDQAFDLVLTDVIMPDMNGPELVQKLLQQKPTLKVIYMSGYTDDAIAEHGVLTQDTHFVAKPFASETLLRKIRETLDSKFD